MDPSCYGGWLYSLLPPGLTLAKQCCLYPFYRSTLLSQTSLKAEVFLVKHSLRNHRSYSSLFTKVS